MAVAHCVTIPYMCQSKLVFWTYYEYLSMLILGKYCSESVAIKEFENLYHGEEKALCLKTSIMKLI